MSGDVQGDTSRIISNQAGADINTDGNDAKILVEDGAEKQTDNIEDIKLIPYSEYITFSEEEKKKWVKYNPSIQSMVYAEYLALQQQAIAGFNDFGAAIEKIKILEKLPLSNIANVLQPIATVFNTASSIINSLTSVPIIGQLASPVFDAILSLAEMIGMMYAMLINPVNMFKAYKDAYDSLDLSNYKEMFEQSDPTENIDVVMAEKQAEMSKIIIPDKEIETLYNNQVNYVNEELTKIKSMYNDTYLAGKQTLDTAKTAMDTIDAAMGGFSLGTSEMIKKAIELQYELSKLEYTKDYSDKANDLKDKISKFNNNVPIKYILASDLEKIKAKEVTTDKSKESSVIFSSDLSARTEEEIQADITTLNNMESNATKLATKAGYDRSINQKLDQITELQNQNSTYQAEYNNTSTSAARKTELQNLINANNATISTLNDEISNLRTLSLRLANELVAAGEVAW